MITLPNQGMEPLTFESLNGSGKTPPLPGNIDTTMNLRAEAASAMERKLEIEEKWRRGMTDVPV